MIKKYRVNGSEHFNLYSMYEHLKVIEIDMQDGIIPWDDTIEERIEEVESLMKKAPYVGSLVDWQTLKRIREIKDERQIIRYCKCIAQGTPERDAALAFDI